MTARGKRWLAVFIVLSVCYIWNLPIWLTFVGTFAAWKLFKP